jgi:hypothetical protein
MALEVSLLLPLTTSIKRSDRKRGAETIRRDPRENSSTNTRAGKKEKKKVKCFHCEGDHYVSQCPELLELQKAKEEGNITAATWEGSTFYTYQVNTIGMKGFSPMEVLLDNQADISIMRLKLLRLLKPTGRSIKVNSIGGVQLVASLTGYLQDFFSLNASEDTKANILCLAE